MIVFRIPCCCLAFLLLVNFCVAQNRSYNTIFDSLVTHDKSIPVIEYTGSWPEPKKQPGNTLKQRLGDKEYTDIQKFRYLHGISCDTIHHLPKTIPDSIDGWKQSLAKKIIEEMFCGEVYEKVIKHKHGHQYRLYVRSNEGVFTMQFKAADSDDLYPQRLVKMINLLLMKKGVKERLIELKYTHYGLKFGLFEPDKIKPLLDKYYVRCFAVGNGGELSTYGKTELK